MSVLLIVLTIAQHVAGGGNGYARYLFPVLGVLATFVVLGLDRLVPRVLPAIVVVLLAWWAIANIPTAVDPHRVRRPRDRGAPAPLALQVLPGNDALRLLIAVVIGVSTVLAVAAVVAARPPPPAPDPERSPGERQRQPGRPAAALTLARRRSSSSNRASPPACCPATR